MYCENCGARIDDDYILCPRCGHRLKDVPLVSPEDTKKEEPSDEAEANSEKDSANDSSKESSDSDAPVNEVSDSGATSENDTSKNDTPVNENSGNDTSNSNDQSFEVSYDPMTGQPIYPVSSIPNDSNSFQNADQPVFDPMTGELIGHKKPPKKFIKPLIIAAVAAGAACLAVTIFLNTPERRFQRAMGRLVSDLSDDASSIYGNNLFYGADTQNVGVQASGSLKAGDGLQNYLRLAGLDIDSGESISAKISANQKNGQASTTAEFKTKQGNTFSIDGYITDIDSSSPEIYLKSDELNPDGKGLYLGPDLYNYDDSISSLQDANLDQQALFNIIDKKTLNKELKKYGTIAVKNLKDVEKSSTSISADGVTEKVTALTVELDRDYFDDLSNELTDAIRDDKDLEEAFDNLPRDMTSDISYDDFLDSIEDSLDSLGDLDSDEIGDIRLTLYMRGMFGTDISGFMLEADRDEFTCIMPRKWNKWGISVSLDGDSYNRRYEMIEGSGKGRNSSLTGQLDINSGTFTSIGEIDLKSFNLDSALKGIPKGQISYQPSREILNDMIYDEKTARILSNFTFAVDFKNSKNKIAFNLEVKDGDDLLASGDFSMKQGKAGRVESPDKNQYYDASDSRDVSRYLSDLNTDSLEAIAKEFGVSNSAIEDFKDNYLYQY